MSIIHIRTRYKICVFCKKCLVVNTGYYHRKWFLVKAVFGMVAYFRKKERKGIVMLERAVNEYWVLYVMAIICTAGVVSRLWLARIYAGLLKDVQYAKEPRKKLIKQIKHNYEICGRLREDMGNIDAFLVKNLYGYRFLGLTLNEIRKISEQAIFFCLAVGGFSAVYAYEKAMMPQIITTYAAVAIVMATVLLYINCIFDVSSRQTVLEAGIMDYLQNYLAVSLEGEIVEPAKTEEVSKKDTPKLKEKMQKSSTAKKPAIFSRREQNRKKEEENTSAKEQAERLLLELRKNPRSSQKPPQKSQEMQGEIDNLRTALNQIAANLEKGRNSENRQLAEEEMQIVEEILGEFLA